LVVFIPVLTRGSAPNSRENKYGYNYNGYEEKSERGYESREPGVTRQDSTIINQYYYPLCQTKAYRMPVGRIIPISAVFNTVTSRLCPFPKDFQASDRPISNLTMIWLVPAVKWYNKGIVSSTIAGVPQSACLINDGLGGTSAIYDISEKKSQLIQFNIF
jgi:hypothetical protein